MNATIQSLLSIKGDIIYYIRLLSLKDYYNYLFNDKKITKRQFDLLNILLNIGPLSGLNVNILRHKPPFSLLYDKVTAQTTKRDLNRLSKSNILLLKEDNKYYLNLKILG